MVYAAKWTTPKALEVDIQAVVDALQSMLQITDKTDCVTSGLLAGIYFHSTNTSDLNFLSKFSNSYK